MYKDEPWGEVTDRGRYASDGSVGEGIAGQFLRIIEPRRGGHL